MRRALPILSIIIVVICGVAAVVRGFLMHPPIPVVHGPVNAMADPALISRGAALASMGNCVECHTQKGGLPFSGGYPLETPFGTIFGSNITPDVKTGIGSWSEVAFERAMRQGIARDGTNLYPAFPYTHFTKATDEDIAALYAYLMSRPPVDNKVADPDMPFPFNVRLGVAAWNILFFREGRFQEDKTQSAEWNRGAYIAESLGHCSLCHTPLNFLGAEQLSKFYGGGEADGWTVPALDRSSTEGVRWTSEQLSVYLKGNFATEHGIAAGPMVGVAAALRKLPDEDVTSLATYIAALNTVEGATPSQEAIDKARSLEFTATKTAGSKVSTAATSGEAIFGAACSTCHFAGAGYPANRPVPLALSSVVQANDSRNFLHVVLGGINSEHGGPGSRSMPAFEYVLSDNQILLLTEYVRSHFSSNGKWGQVDEALADIRKHRDGNSN